MTARLALLACLLMPAGCAPHRAAPQARPPDPRRLPINVTDAASGRPLAGAIVSVASMFPSRLTYGYTRAGATDARGHCDVALPPPAGGNVYVRVAPAGFVPMRLPIRLPPGAVPEPMDLALERGTTLGGVVRNEDGKPVAGAEVRFDVATEAPPNGPTPDFDDLAVKTGPDGRWTADAFPAGTPQVTLLVSHPDYVSPFAGVPDSLWTPLDALRKRESVTVLKRGLPLAGAVTDTDGQPLAGAKLVLGFAAGWLDNPPSATTDAAGQYRFAHVGKGKVVLTAQAPGRAPDAKEVVVRDGIPPVDFRLAKGSTLRLRVTDSGGAPVAGATVQAWMWRGRQNLAWSARTGPDGRVAGGDLPADEVRYSVFAPGRMAREVALKAGGVEQVVELRPALRVAGVIFDAETGRAVSPVRVTSGFDLGDGTGTRWERPEPTTARGRYERVFEGAMAGYQMRFEADGYVPQVSRTFKPDEGPVSFDVKLARQRGPSLIVVGPDGKPAAGVEVVAVGAAHKQVTIQDGRIATTFGPDPSEGATPQYPVPSRSRAGGRVDVALPEGPYLLVASGEPGFETLASDKVRADGEARITLRPWHRVVGSGMTGAQRKAGQIVTIRAARPVRIGPGSITLSVESTGFTDADGHFRIEKCVPGPAVAGRVVMRPEQVAMTPEDLLPIEIPEDQPEVELKGVEGARSIVATVVPPDDFPPEWAQKCMAYLQKKPPALPTPKGWLFMGVEARGKWMEEFKETDAGKAWTREASVFRLVMLGWDGAVRIDDVRPGSYTFTVQTGEPRWGRLSQDVEVPKEGQGPIDLGRLELLPRFWPKLGKPTSKPAAAE